MQEITNIRIIPESKSDIKIAVWENLQLLVLFGTILGQTLVGGLYLLAQSIWLACNVLALVRDFVLYRPIADKIKNAALCGLTLGLILLRIMGLY